MAMWSISNSNSNGEIDRIEASTKAAALKKAKAQGLNNWGDRNAMGRVNNYKLYAKKLWGGGGKRNPAVAVKSIKVKNFTGTISNVRGKTVVKGRSKSS